MRQRKFWFAMSGILAVLAMALMLPAGAAAASKYKVLHRFAGGKDGEGGVPEASLILDTAGNLYGTTYGNASSGTVFKLTPNPDGTWKERVLASFTGHGHQPWASVIFDAAGSLYGTTPGGGTHHKGTVFKLTPKSDGTWKGSMLHSFTGGDGAYPYAGLIFDTAGNLYGTTQQGGTGCSPGCGTVFELSPNQDGSWTERVLHEFGGVGDGAIPSAGLIFDAAGNLYSTTWSGGANGGGTVFRLKPNPDGSWTESVLYSFSGFLPSKAGLALDTAGNLYGTTPSTVFKLTPNSDGSWTERVLHEFKGGPGENCYAGLIFDGAGNLYGTSFGDYSGDYGAVFKLRPNSNGSWAYSVLHVFRGKPAANPYDSLVLDKAGNLYGTTTGCGDANICRGVVFEITP